MGLLLIAAIYVGWYSFSRGASKSPPNLETHLAKHRTIAPTEKPKLPAAPKVTPPPASPEAAAAIVQAREVAIDQMHDAAVTYDKAQLPVIQPYLVDPDPELRAAAADCMIILGDASAGPMLREAAKKVDSAQEAKDLEKKADYVELPPIDIKKASKQFKNGGLEGITPHR